MYSKPDDSFLLSLKSKPVLITVYFVKYRNKYVNHNLKISMEHDGSYHYGGLQEFHVMYVSRRGLKIAKSNY